MCDDWWFSTESSSEPDGQARVATDEESFIAR